MPFWKKCIVAIYHIGSFVGLVLFIVEASKFIHNLISINEIIIGFVLFLLVIAGKGIDDGAF